MTYLIFNVRNFGALGDGTNDDTKAIQAAIAAAEAFIPITNTYAPQAPSVYLPPGQYKTTSSLLISKPILVYGEGPEQTQIIGAGANVPVIQIQQTSSQSTYITYELKDFAIVGLNTDFTVQDGQDGIQVSSTANDITAKITNVRVIECTGNGINFPNQSNSSIIKNCIMQLNSKAGITFGTGGGSTGFCTNTTIDKCYVRQNRIGIWMNGDPTYTLNEGRITKTLIESNISGSGTLGSADRPAIGLRLSNVFYLAVEYCHIENQANDIYCDSLCSCNYFLANLAMAGSGYLSLPQTYGGPPARQMGIYITNGVQNEFVHNFWLVPPSKPSGVTDANWGTSTFGATYPSVTDTTGSNLYRGNIGAPANNGSPTITNPTNNHVIEDNSLFGSVLARTVTNVKGIQWTVGSAIYPWIYATAPASAPNGPQVVGAYRVNAIPASGAPLGWVTTSAGTPGTAETTGWVPGVSADNGDNNVTATVNSIGIQIFATTLTANRTVTLSTSGAGTTDIGKTIRVVRTGLGAFTLNVGGLKTIPSATAAFVDAVWNGSAWILTGYGTL